MGGFDLGEASLKPRSPFLIVILVHCFAAAVENFAPGLKVRERSERKEGKDRF
jgi:hypothetical protein